MPNRSKKGASYTRSHKPASSAGNKPTQRIATSNKRKALLTYKQYSPSQKMSGNIRFCRSFVVRALRVPRAPDEAAFGTRNDHIFIIVLSTGTSLACASGKKFTEHISCQNILWIFVKLKQKPPRKAGLHCQA
jgi:hypothetical protein